LFIIYTVDLIALIERRELSPHLFTGDILIYGKRRPAAAELFSPKGCVGVDVIASWMKSNRIPAELQYNWGPMMCHRSASPSPLSTIALLIDSSPVAPISSLRKLVIYVEDDLVMRSHMQSTASLPFDRQLRRSVSAAYDSYSDARSLWFFLDCKYIAYGRGMVGLAAYQVCRFQSVLNAAAGLSSASLRAHN
jgi:hypothetical protein